MLAASLRPTEATLDDESWGLDHGTWSVLTHVFPDADIPVIGHCLGGQLMSKALGGTVGANPVKEIGWRDVTLRGEAAREWFGDREGFLSFHWHGETFSLPDGATPLLASDACTPQAWAIGTQEIPAQFAGPQMDAMRKLDFIDIPR